MLGAYGRLSSLVAELTGCWGITSVIALAALFYALLGLWGRWPAVCLALLVGIAVILLHGIGYGPRKSSD